MRRHRGIEGRRRLHPHALLGAAAVAIAVVLIGAATAAASVVNGWGRNDEGQLGLGTTTGPNLCKVNGSEHGCALTAQLVPELSEPTAVSAGTSHTLVLLSGGTVMAFGGNASGQLGNGTTTNSDVPVAVSGLSEVTAVSAGTNHSLALLANGTVWAWGANASGQLGNGTTTASTTPVEVSGLKEVVAIAAGDAFSLALRANGTVASWGTNQVGQLGNGTQTASDVPVSVSGLNEVTQISAGFAHSLALLASGGVKSWGFNLNGELGNGSDEGPSICLVNGVMDPCAKTPVAVTGLTEATSVAAGEGHSVASRKDGEAVAWGDNEEGQLGDGTFEERLTPVTVEGLSGVSSVAAGGSTSLALLGNGRVMAWGLNSYGELGNGAVELSRLPVQVCGLAGVQALATRGAHGEALATSAPACPAVTKLEPSFGSTGGGTSVTITGANFTEATAVHFGKTAAASFTVESPTTITAVAPAGGSTVNVTVTTPLGTSPLSAADQYTFRPPPAITSVAPDTGPAAGGRSVTITGAGFLEASEVSFGSTPATTYTVESASTIKATAPAGTGIVDVRVTTPLGESNIVGADTFTYLKAPEFGRCLKVKAGSGLYSSGTCSVTGGTKVYEWYPAFGGLKPLPKTHFTMKSKELTEMKLAPATGEAIICKAETGAGEIVGPRSVAGVTITFTGCHHGVAGSCTTSGDAEGEITTASLKGELGIVKTSTEGPQKNKQGLDLAPASGTVFAEFACAGVPVVWTGSAIVEVLSNSMVATLTTKYSGSKGVQKPAAFEGGPEDQPFVSFNGEAAKKAALTLTNIVTFEEKTEISSVA